jgi:hypothetical protein
LGFVSSLRRQIADGPPCLKLRHAGVTELLARLEADIADGLEATIELSFSFLLSFG